MYKKKVEGTGIYRRMDGSGGGMVWECDGLGWDGMR